MSFDVSKVKEDFPALTQKVNDKPLVYLDSAASALKPRRVIDSLTQFYSFEASNVHRGIHTLSAKATDRYEESRRVVQRFLGAGAEEEIVFTSGTTESINLVAGAWAEAHLNSGDVILLSEQEHHSNLVPWHMLAERKKVELKFIPVTDVGEFDLQAYQNLLNEKVKLVAISHCSNTLGTIHPISEMTKMAHAVGAKIAIDGAQAVTCMQVDVRELDCDFYSFSGHKLFGPYGIGILFGKREILEKMPPYHGGGSMIDQVELDKSTFGDVPFRFEAGTPNISGAIGMAESILYLEEIGISNVEKYEEELAKYATEQLKQIEGLRFIGASEKRAPIFSFVIDGIHSADIGEILDQYGIAVRTGHHCTQPLMKRMNVTSTVRASFSIYNDKNDVDQLVEGLKKAQKMLA